MSDIHFDTEELKVIVAKAIQDKVASAINYGEMHKLIDNVMEERKIEFDKLLNEMFDSFFKDVDVKQALLEEFKHKIAKTMVAKLEGAVEKNINQYRQNPTTNAKMILAIEKIINEADNE